MPIELRRFFYLIGAFFVSLFLCIIFIKLLLKRKTRGQVERDFALKSHLKKDGTPTMGGIAIVLSSVIISFLFNINNLKDSHFIALLFVYLVYFIIGFIDDYLKIKFNNYEGLKGKYRLLFEAIAVFMVIPLISIYINKYTYIEINLFKFILPIGFGLLVLIILLVVGISNSVNLSDGLDGLASGMMMSAILPFIVVSINKQQLGIAIILISTLGSLVAFLIFNMHPAKIFMGDCGSLALGALISFCGIILKEYLILLISCSFFIFEALSVIIQVLYYKKTKKRIFLMAPFHHHLEKKGQPEWKIVMMCWIYGLVCSIICVIIEVI
ncbi:MAG: phospho-N-acetylmuramoyl-pentapeptide-transferase [Bacilli bacterium]|nr:phospho-N-acetylmuramoyl-pentapeptide-transferase [Bacilli bacterium]